MIGQKKRKLKRYLSLFLTLLLLVSVVPLPVFAQEDADPAVEIQEAIDQVTVEENSEKISEELKQEMEASDWVEIIVYMKDKLDSIAFAEQALAKHSLSMNAYNASLQVRRDLVIALKDQTHRSQYGLRQLIEKSGDQVSDFRSFFIANVAYMKVKPEVVEKIAKLPEVDKVLKNQTYYLEDYTIEENTLQADENLWSLNLVRAPEAWEIGIDGTGAVVGLLDSGTDYNHPALHDNWRGLAADGTEDATYSWLDTVAEEPLPVDSDSHGTHVAGTMVGRDTEADVTTGVAPGAKWICARVFNESGRTSAAQLIEAAEWMIAPGGNPDMAPDVVNNSWGGGSGLDDWYIQYVDNYIAAGILPVFAAGNQRQGEPLPGPGSISIPANYENSFAVGAVDRNKRRGSFSKRGPSPYTDNWKPEISAPGVDVYSALPNGKYGTMSGTSMAAPHVAGVVALMRSADKTLAIEEIKSLLFENAEPLTDADPNAQSSPNHDYGYGLVDGFQSVIPVSGGVGTFTGKVLRFGSDQGPAVINHEQTVTELYLGSPLRVEVEITDDVSILEAYMQVRPIDGTWEDLTLRQVTGGAKGGSYEGKIPASVMGTGQGFEYRFVAKDYAENISESEAFKVNFKFGVKPDEYFESFEGEYEGWIMDYPWEVGSPSLDTEPTVPDGEKYMATKIGGNYSGREDAYLISVPIDMRQTDEASVRFLHWYDFWYYQDFGVTFADEGTVYISNDFGETLTEVAKFNKSSNKWLGQVIDLSPYAHSGTPVYIIFKVTSEGMEENLGWYIDSFSVEAEDNTPPGAPYNLESTSTLSAIELTWEFDMVPDFAEYEIYRSTSASSLGTLIAKSNTESYKDLYVNGLEDNTDYYYRIKAKDMFGNISEASNQIKARKANITTIKAWDFEENDGGFTTGEFYGSENDWEWGQIDPEHGPGAAYTGSKVWATGLDHDYSENVTAYLQTPQIEIPASGSSYLLMNHWYLFELYSIGSTKWDYGQIHIKRVEDSEWVNITPEDDDDLPGEGKFGGPPPEEVNDWRYLELDISEYAASTVEIRFYYESDSSGNFAGWFINDVNIVNVPQSESSISEETEEIISSQDDYRIADFSLDFDSVGYEENSVVLENDTSLSNIPLPGAIVSVVETGITTIPNDRTAIYRLDHKASDEGTTWTLKAEAYGYIPEYFESALLEEETVEHDFVLREQATGTIRGQVYDRYSFDPAAYAVVSIVNDPNVEPVIADENGNFVIEHVYIGEYTLHASAEHFENGTATVTVNADEEAECNIALKRFVGVPGEIIYDDGEAENATVLVRPDCGVAMRFTPERYGKLLRASFYFWGEDWPTPGGNEIGFGIIARDPMGGYKQIGETIVADDIVRGDWYTVDFSDMNFSTDEDFFVTTIQTKEGSLSPGIGLDDSVPREVSERSYFYIDGNFRVFTSQDYENYGAMIRATIEYDADPPVITNLDDVTYTSEDAITVEGNVMYEQGQVLIYSGDQVIETIEPEEIEDRSFSTTITLTEEVTTLKAALKVGDKETEPSAEKLIIKDQVAPTLQVSEPSDGEHVNVELIHVAGTVVDKYLDKLLINDVEVEVDEESSFDYKMILSKGQNDIEIRAIDKAGNETVEKRTVYAKFDDISLYDLQPASDVFVAPGDSVDVSFRGPRGGQAYYTVIWETGLEEFTTNSIPMQEVEAGLYKATWTAGNETLKDAEVFFEFTDAYGNYVETTADGKISVIMADIVDRLYGSNRYKTAAKMSQFMYKKSDVVILASGENFPDALVAGPYAEKIDAPILLTRRSDLPTSSLNEIKRLNAKEVKILGGELAISKAVEKSLKDEGLTVERIAGSNRFATAVEISALARAADSSHVFLANGYNYADGLSIAPAAAKADDAILLTKTDSLHKVTLDALKAWGTESITIMGGNLAVSKQVEQELKSLGYRVNRIQGSNRYKTNIDIARNYFPAATKAVGVSGADFPDAMIATVYAAKEGRPIILLDPEGLRDITIEYFVDEPINHVLLLGGELAVPKVIEYHIRGLLK